MTRNIALLLLLCSLSLAARAADVFKWVDDDGKVHYGESVPERYKQKARKVDLTGEASAEQRQEAEARRARDKARAESLRGARETQADAPQIAAPVPPANPAQATDECQEQLRKYLESQDCFAPFRLANGAIRPEAFQQCKEVKQPKGCFPKSNPADRTYLPPASSPTAPPAP